jgi:type II secretory pathway component PulL
MNKTFVPMLALLSMTSSSAVAASSEAEKQAACQEDATRLCSEFIPDRDKITLCMQKKIAQLGPACRAIFNEEAGGKPRAK